MSLINSKKVNTAGSCKPIIEPKRCKIRSRKQAISTKAID